jgi:hypothetical protein
MANSNLGAIFLMPQFERQDLPRAEAVLHGCAIKLRASCVSAIAYLHMLPEKQDIARAFAWASLGSDLGMPASVSQVGQLQPQMTAAEIEAATREKSALLLEVAGGAKARN